MAANTAEYVRDIPDNESMSQTVEDAKSLTFSEYREHAVLRIEGGRSVLVRGGHYGIDLERTIANDSFGRPLDRLFVSIDGTSFMVQRLIFHVHPKPTGPSDDDLLVLELLGQDESLLYEIFGDAEGTIIRPKSRKVSDAE